MRIACLAVIIAFIVVATSRVSGQVRYTVTEIPAPAGENPFVFAINDSGIILCSASFSGLTRTYLVRGTTTQIVDSVFGSNLNGRTQVTGYWGFDENFFHACRWTNGTVTDLDPGHVGYSFGHSINDSGHVAGQRGLGATKAALWRNGTITILQGDEGNSAAGSINNAGQTIVSSYYETKDTAYSRWYIWHNGALTQLPGISMQAWDINNLGHVVGRSRVSVNGDFRASRIINGVVTLLGTLGGTESGARAINDLGAIVGHSTLVGGSTPRPFLYENGAMTDLNTLIPPNSGWVLHEAIDINNKRQIVGKGTLNGQGKGFLLTPLGLPILRPLPGERWIGGDLDTIRWTRGEANQFVDIQFSTDSGLTYTLIDFAEPADSGYYVWTVPDSLTTRAKIRLLNTANQEVLAVSDTFKVKGYVLTRMKSNGHYERFSSGKHGWSYANGTLWPQAWWSQFRYRTGNDPSTGSTYPSFFHAVPDSNFVDWPLWVETFSESQCYWWTSLGGNYRGHAQRRWKEVADKHMGSCFGFAASSALAFSYPNQFFPRHPGVPSGMDVFTIPLSDSTLKTINRYFAYQYGQQSLANDVTGQVKNPRTTLQEIRNMFREDNVNVRTISMYGTSAIVTGAHTMLPISITVDGSGPARFRVNLYDSNNPGLNTPYVLIDSLNNTWRDFTGLQWGPSSNRFYLEIPASNYLSTPTMGRAPLEHIPKGTDNVEFYNTSIANVLYTASNGNRIGFVHGTLIEEIPDGIAIFNKNGRPSKPIGYYIPDDVYSVVLGEVTDPSRTAYITVFKDGVVYGYEKVNADSLQVDKFRFGQGFSVASSDTAQKQISLNIIARLDSSERIFFVRNTQLRQNDSLFTREISQSNLVLKNYGTAKTYHLEINERSAQEQEIFVHPLIALPANSTHTIVPNWIDLDGSPIEILVDLGNNGTIDDTLIVNNTLDVDDRGDLGVPREYNLGQNYPNPFNPNTRIEYTLPQAGHVNLSVYNVLGQHVATLVDEQRSAGRYSVEWNGTSANGGILGSGVYFYTMIARPSAGGETFRRTGKMLLLK